MKWLKALLLTLTLVAQAPAQQPTAAQSLRLALADALTLNPLEARNTRYISAHNHAWSYEKLLRDDIVLKGQLPSISVGSELTGVRPIAFVKFKIKDDKGREQWASAPWLWAFDGSRYGTNLVAFANLNYADPYYHDPTRTVTKESAIPSWLPRKEYQDLSAVVQTQRGTPIMRFDYFIYRTSFQSGAFNDGYQNFLGVTTFQEFQKLCGFDEETAEGLNADRRGFVTESEVGINIRGITRGDGTNGPYWYTDDFENNFGHHNVVRLLDKARANARMDIGSLRNGLAAYGLFAVQWKDGKSSKTFQAAAPDFIAGNQRSYNMDRRVHNGQCMHCHVNGALKEFKTEQFDFYGGRGQPELLTFKDARGLRLKAVYFGVVNDRPEIEVLLEQDQKRFNMKMKMACGVDYKLFSKYHREVMHEYEQKVNLLTLQYETGVNKDTIIRALRNFDERETGNDPIINAFVTKGQVRRELLEEVFNILMATLQQESVP